MKYLLLNFSLLFLFSCIIDNSPQDPKQDGPPPSGASEIDKIYYESKTAANKARSLQESAESVKQTFLARNPGATQQLNNRISNFERALDTAVGAAKTAHNLVRSTIREAEVLLKNNNKEGYKAKIEEVRSAVNQVTGAKNRAQEMFNNIQDVIDDFGSE